MRYLSTGKAKQRADQMQANNTSFLNVIKDYDGAGKALWRLQHGTDANGGFEIDVYKIREEAIQDAVVIAQMSDFPLTITYPHGKHTVCKDADIYRRKDARP